MGSPFADGLLIALLIRCADVTERAKEIAASIAGGPPPEALGSGATFARPPRRCLTGAAGVVSGAFLAASSAALMAASLTLTEMIWVTRS